MTHTIRSADTYDSRRWHIRYTTLIHTCKTADSYVCERLAQMVTQTRTIGANAPHPYTITLL